MGFVYYYAKLFKGKSKYKFLRDNKKCMQEELLRTKNIIPTCTSIGYLECHEGGEVAAFFLTYNFQIINNE